MSHSQYKYALVVDWDDDGCVARIEDDEGTNSDTPLRGYGDSPVAALRELVRTLADWQQGGSERWLDTPAGTKLARQFVPDFEPRRTGGQA